MDEILEVKNVTVRIGREKLLSDVSFSVHKGETCGIVGRNGSGKTVLLKTICGFIPPASGQVLQCGRTIGKDTEFIQNAGFLIEHPSVLPNKTGFENLCYLAGIRGRIDREKIMETLRIVGLEEAAHKKAGAYSLGMKQRLGIAQSIMEDPEIVILDEPMNGLDDAGAADIRRLLQKLSSEGKTILLVSHNHEDIDMLCRRVFRIDRGILQPAENI